MYQNQENKGVMTVNMTLASQSISNSKMTAQFNNGALASGSNTLYNEETPDNKVINSADAIQLLSFSCDGQALQLQEYGNSFMHI